MCDKGENGLVFLLSCVSDHFLCMVFKVHGLEIVFEFFANVFPGCEFMFYLSVEL